ncbi:MAG: rRNA maturation RNase YbeY [bacterium]
MKLDIINNSDYHIDSGAVKQLCCWLNRQPDIDLPAEISLVFVTDEVIAGLNEKYYGRRGVTDVLSFPYGDCLAEIILNPAQQHRQAGQFDNSFSEEVAENIIHAFLHLAGYDHTGPEDNGEHLRRQRELITEYKNQSPPLLVEEKQGMINRDG